MKFHDYLFDLPTYQAGKPLEEVMASYHIPPENIIKLGSNENPFGVAPSAKKAIIEYANLASVYPDDSYSDIKKSLANKYDVKSDNIIIGSGSDQIIEFCVHSICDSAKTILMAQYTFAMYEIYAKQCNANIIKTTSFFHDLDSMIDMYHRHKPDIIFICTPNNPLGEALKRVDLIEFLNKISTDCLVILDCAYMEYCAYKDNDFAIYPKDIVEFPNVIYLGTFSKIYGLGGMRIGYGIANDNIISLLHKLRPPFNVTTLSLRAANASLQDIDFISKTLQNNFTQMQRYYVFADEYGLEIIESYGNFVTFLLHDKLNSTTISSFLLKQGIVVRDLSSYGLNAMRITIGTPSQNDFLLSKMAGILISYKDSF
ncbi:histidinol-phosphate transaminase [Helicobacter muridarum]|uniref:Histidinol-phosphate aminotransferase n=1 Tax=Helicobacter muridarum TaxID=216 RepID=A0A099TXZ3_9HELI|nr:histidinol-phosphate transaminase [Helicobacter muridarum]TLD99846.1 histidinol-phosphate transaminase [Helicobacter muridarum]STQ86945.1 histidinol-phosphate aminotransferase [Helicobacter muridarum]